MRWEIETLTVTQHVMNRIACIGICVTTIGRWRVKKKKRKTVICATRLDKYPYVMVSNTPDDRESVRVVVFTGKGVDGYGLKLPRDLARLTAKRINQFLDFTVKK